MTMIDTHAHLNFNAFKDDYAEVIERSFNNGLKAIINVGAKLDSSQRAIELAEQFENLYVSVGLHPIHVNDEDFNLENYQQLVKNEKVMAIGETGLDYFHIQDEKIQERQKDIFKEFIDLSKERGSPMILHCRGSRGEPLKAYEEMLEILKEKKYYQGVIHCFTANKEIAQEFLNLGFYIGFTGVITFAPELARVVKFVPLDRILLETDCPFMSPEPYRGQRCEPWYVKFTAEKIAEIKGMGFQEVINSTTENAQNLFGVII